MADGDERRSTRQRGAVRSAPGSALCPGTLRAASSARVPRTTSSEQKGAGGRATDSANAAVRARPCARACVRPCVRRFVRPSALACARARVRACVRYCYMSVPANYVAAARVPHSPGPGAAAATRSRENSRSPCSRERRTRTRRSRTTIAATRKRTFREARSPRRGSSAASLEATPPALRPVHRAANPRDTPLMAARACSVRASQSCTLSFRDALGRRGLRSLLRGLERGGIDASAQAGYLQRRERVWLGLLALRLQGQQLPTRCAACVPRTSTLMHGARAAEIIIHKPSAIAMTVKQWWSDYDKHPSAAVAKLTNMMIEVPFLHPHAVFLHSCWVMPACADTDERHVLRHQACGLPNRLPPVAFR